MKLLKSVLSILSLTIFSSAANTVENIEPAISENEIEIGAWLESQEEDMLKLLERITNINSGTLNKDGVDELATIFSAELRNLGFSVSTLPGDFIEMPSCPGSDYDIDVTDHVLASNLGEGQRFLLSLIHI